MLSGIIGTKEYRKPEWVTHMEELQAALKGKPECSSMLHAHSCGMSTDSLETPHPIPKSENHGQGRQYSTGLSLDGPSFYLTEEPNASVSSTSSFASVYSEPNRSTKSKVSFIESAMTDYLNSHRHSLSSVMDLIDKSVRGRDMTKKVTEEIQNEPVIEHPDDSEDDEIYLDAQSRQSPQPFFILSPIEEKSEPSTRSSSFRGSNGSEKRKMASFGDIMRQKLCSSCDPIPSEKVNFDYMPEKFQTFPRVKNENIGDHMYRNYYDHTMYPLEPRELDPCGYQQLHTADSQEELQEFLLLESECMTDRGRGLASAFTSSNSDENNSHNTKGNL